jgi:gliding motility-associated lipoprotein GldD
MKLSSKTFFYFLTFVLVIGLVSCDNEDEVFSPKPKGYFRINFPEKSYRVYDSICPYKFEIPTYSRITKDTHKGAEPCWLNLEFPKFNATIYLSYKLLNNDPKYKLSHNDLDSNLEKSHYFANKHQIKATGLEEIPIIRDSAKVYGLVFDIAGNTASSVQFYLTDSTHHFLRGSLYFYSTPNIDSLRIVVDFIKKDILHLINTTSWKTDTENPISGETKK